MEEEGAEEKGADGNEDGGGDDEDGEGQGWAGQEGCEEVVDFGKVGEGSDVEAEIHDLEQEEEGLGYGPGDFGEFFRGSKDTSAERGRWICGLGEGRRIGRGVRRAGGIG